MKKNISQLGFTLIEAVVASGVFAFVIASSLGVYMSTVQLDAKTRTERAVQQNARFIMDFFSKEIRNGSIDYSRENDIDTLSLKNQQNEEVQIYWMPEQKNLVLSKTGIGTNNLNSDDIEVIDVKFILSQTVDPFVLANNSNIQPHVIISIEIQSKHQKGQEGSAMRVQSTFAVREYPSRQ